MKFVWLASYPKSGNTWLRILLSHYLTETGEGWHWNSPLIGPSSHLERHGFDEAMGIASADIDRDSIESLRRQFHAQFATKFSGLSFAKTHEAFYSTRDGKPMFPADPGTKAVYLVRNPLDLVSSYAHHENRSVDAIIDHLADSNALVETSDTFFNEHLGHWSEHVAGWTGQDDLEALLVRFEDLVSDTSHTFSCIAEFCGLEIDREKIEKAVAASKFERLQSQELRSGFRAFTDTSRRFFRTGKTGEWQTELTPGQVKQIVSEHGEMMERLSYRAADAA